MKLPNYPLDTVAGIDLSMRSPAICIIRPCSDNLFLMPFETCEFYFLTNHSKAAIDKGNIHGFYHGSWASNEDRFGSIAEWAVDVLVKNKVKAVGIEGYAYSSFSNNLTQIAEMTGVLKHYLHKEAIPYNIFTPSSIKKSATGKGNANKALMYEAWLEDTQICLNSIFRRKPDATVKSPVHDIVDSYYIACCERIENINQSKGTNNDQTAQGNDRI